MRVAAVALAVSLSLFADRATFENPQQYAVGVKDVFVNGVQVLKRGKHTGAKPGRVVRGAGWRGAPERPSH